MILACNSAISGGAYGVDQKPRGRPAGSRAFDYLTEFVIALAHFSAGDSFRIIIKDP